MMNKNALKYLKAEEEKYIKHYKRIYADYIETMGGNGYRSQDMKKQVLAYQRGQVVEAGNVLKTVFNYTAEDIGEIERQIERRYLSDVNN